MHISHFKHQFIFPRWQWISEKAHISFSLPMQGSCIQYARWKRGILKIIRFSIGNKNAIGSKIIVMWIALTRTESAKILEAIAFISVDCLLTFSRCLTKLSNPVSYLIQFTDINILFPGAEFFWSVMWSWSGPCWQLKETLSKLESPDIGAC